MEFLDVRKDHIRFGFSPARECLRGIRVLLQPAEHAEQMPWVRLARRRFSKELRASIESFRFFFEGRAESFPFLWDESRGADFEHELRELRSNLEVYRDAVLFRLRGKNVLTLDELREMRGRRWYRPAAAEYASRNPRSVEMLARFVDSPARSLRAFCEMLEDFHAHVFAPEWKPIHERLTADIGMRKRVLHDYGLTALLRTLGPDISAQRSRAGADVKFGRGDSQLHFETSSLLTLTPSFFCWPGHEVYLLRKPSGIRSTIAYPVPPLTARAPKLEGRDVLAQTCNALGDRVRLRIMELLNARELSTRELAAFLKLAEPVVSRHLQLLLRAELVRARRAGYFVMYSPRRETFQRLTDALSALR